MSISFSGIPTLALKGVTSRFPVTLPQGASKPPNFFPPSVVPVTIDWNVYWQILHNVSNVGVNCNLQAASVMASILDRIASVKIDNTGSPNSVYVVFDDTKDVIACPPNAAVTFPCLTNLLQATVYIEGLTPGFIPTTRIFFYNIVLPPSVDYEVNQSINLQKASPSISRGTTLLNTNYEPPALGDQLQASGLLNAAVVNATVPLWGTPYPPGTFLYLTSLVINGMGLSNAVPVSGSCIIESTGVAGTLVQPVYYLTPNAVVGVTNILTLNAMQIKLDAGQSWRIRIIQAGDGGTLQVYTAFTQTPL